MKFASNLSYYRKQNNLSQEQLAELCNVSRQSVAKWEKGLSEPGLSTVEMLAKQFNITIDELVMGETSMAQLERMQLLKRIRDKTRGFTDPDTIQAIEYEICSRGLCDIITRLDCDDLQDKDKIDYLNEVLKKTSENEEEPDCFSLQRRLLQFIPRATESPEELWQGVKFILGVEPKRELS